MNLIRPAQQVHMFFPLYVGEVVTSCGQEVNGRFQESRNCQSALEPDTEPQIAPDAASSVFGVNVRHGTSH